MEEVLYQGCNCGVEWDFNTTAPLSGLFFEEGSEPLLGGKVEFWSGNGTRHKRKHGIACPDIRSERILDMEREISRLSHDLEYLSAKGSLGAT